MRTMMMIETNPHCNVHIIILRACVFEDQGQGRASEKDMNRRIECNLLL